MSLTRLRPTTAWVKVEDLNVDYSYQRPLKKRFQEIADTYDDRALGIPLVAVRPSGLMFLTDGQQRLAALRARGVKYIEVKLFQSSGPTEEAEVFRLANRKTELTSLEKYRAALVAGESVAVLIDQVLKRTGYRASDKNISTDSPAVGCFKAMATIVSTHGPHSLEFALLVAKEAWPGDRYGRYDTMVRALARVHGEGLMVSPGKAAKALSKHQPRAILLENSNSIGDRASTLFATICKVLKVKAVKA